MSTLALNNLANYILSLGLSQRNRRWLAERLLEPEAKAETPNAVTLTAMKELESGKDAGKVDLSSLNAFVASMQ